MNADNGKDCRTGTAKGGKTVMAFGTFDFLHAGHLHYLREAKEIAGKGGRLVVVVADDVVAEREKGHAPVNSAKDRAELVGAMKAVDAAVIGSAETAERFDVVKKYKPDLIVLGYDARENETELMEQLRAAGMKTVPRVLRAKGYKTEINKSSALKKMLPLV
ncbi:MAG: adenylyltransferase/cytidyltransferase family protein [Candidatus Diapherotrites archaeon]